MKKNFLNGVCAKMAFVVVALAATFFTSCEKENFVVEFEADPAKVYISPTVIDAATNTDVTAIATISGTTELTGNKDIAAQEVTVTATVNGISGTATVKVANIKAGHTATYTPTIILSGDFELKGSLTAGTPVAVWGIMDQSHKPSHSHDGKSWFENATEYIKTYKVEYEVISGTEYSDVNIITPSAELSVFIASLETSKKKEETTVTEFKVSAWSIFYTMVEYTTSTGVRDIVSKVSGEVVATVKASEYSCSDFSYGETFHPSHAGHYHYGHGAHGTGSNAGGGIVIAD